MRPWSLKHGIFVMKGKANRPFPNMKGHALHTLKVFSCTLTINSERYVITLEAKFMADAFSVDKI